jgi:hypothetical protein
MRKNGATVSRSSLRSAAMSRHPSGRDIAVKPFHPNVTLRYSRGSADGSCGAQDRDCSACAGSGWVRAVVELPMQLPCPVCAEAVVR